MGGVKIGNTLDISTVKMIGYIQAQILVDKHVKKDDKYLMI